MSELSFLFLGLNVRFSITYSVYIPYYVHPLFKTGDFLLTAVLS